MHFNQISTSLTIGIVLGFLLCFCLNRIEQAKARKKAPNIIIFNVQGIAVKVLCCSSRPMNFTKINEQVMAHVGDRMVYHIEYCQSDDVLPNNCTILIENEQMEPT